MADMVTFTPEELAEIASNAERRNVIKEAREVQTRKISDSLSDLKLHELEVMGQAAVAKHMGWPMDWSILAGGSRAPHFRVNGITIRVQTPTHYPPILKLNRAQDFDTDLMVVCAPWPGEPAVIAICGCVSRERFLREHRLMEFGKGKRLSMLSCYLTPIADYQEEAGRAPRKAAAMEAGPSSGSGEKLG